MQPHTWLGLFQHHLRVEDVYPRRQSGSQHEQPTEWEQMRISLFSWKLTEQVKQKDVLGEEKKAPSPAGAQQACNVLHTAMLLWKMCESWPTVLVTQMALRGNIPCSRGSCSMKQTSRPRDSINHGAAEDKARDRELMKQFLVWAGPGNPSSIPRAQ